MKQIAVILALAIVGSASAAQQSKQLEITAPVKPQQQIVLKDFSGADLTVTTWDKPSVLVRLNVEVSSSDDEWEDEYVVTEVRFDLTLMSPKVEFTGTYDGTRFTFTSLVSYRVDFRKSLLPWDRDFDKFM